VSEDQAGWLRLSRSCNNACRFCNEVESLDGRPLDVVALVRAVRHHARSGCGRLTLSGGEPTASPHLLTVLEAAQKLRLGTTLVTNGRSLGSRSRLQLLHEAGLDELHVSLHGATAATHDGLVGATGAFDQVQRTLRAAREAALFPLHVRTVVTAENLDELPALATLLGSHGVRSWQLREVEDAGRAHADALRSPPPAAVLAGLDALLPECARLGLPLELHGFESLRGVDAEEPSRPPPVLTASLLSLLRRGIRPASVQRGVRLRDPASVLAADDAAARPAREELLSELAALGVVASDRAAPEARPGWQPKRTGARVVVLAPPGRDPIQNRSTLPALASTLAAHGADVVLGSPFQPGLSAVACFRKHAADESPTRPDPMQALAEVERLAELARAELVVVNDFTTALAVLEGGALAADAQLVIGDYHMLTGIEGWLARYAPARDQASEGRWWPDPRVHVHSCFAGYLHLYRNYGIPFAQIDFAEYTLDGAHFPLGPEPASCAHIHSGGNHLRDLATLLSALERTREGALHPIDLYSQEPIDPRAPNLRFRGRVKLLDFYDALARSRFGVVPLEPDPHRAAGVTVVAMAQMAGRPVIATDVPAVRDHVRDGVDGLLVPPRDPAALAEAITRLDGDADLLARLSAGAREARARVSVERWARRLLGDAADASRPGTLQRVWPE
jgi:pyruvate-formate lyase-activating enzyme